MRSTIGKIRRTAALVLALFMMAGCFQALAESYSAAVMTDAQTVYTDAGLSEAVGSLNKYEIVTVLDEAGGALKIQYRGYTFYAPSGSLTAVKDFAVESTVNTATRVFEAANAAGRSAALPKDTVVYVLATSGSWAMIEKNGYVGYAYVGYITPNVLTDAGSFDTTTPANPSTPVDTTTPADTTASTSSVTTETFNAKVNATSLPVYKSASADSKRLGTLYSGQQVTVYAYNSDWAYIALSGHYGFCAVAGLSRVTVENTTPEASKDGVIVQTIDAEVSASTLSVYKSASTTSQLLGTLAQGTQVTVYAYNDAWAYIGLNGNYGFCVLGGLKKRGAEGSTVVPETPSGNESYTATVTAETVAVYESASTSSTRLGTLKKGAEITVEAFNSTWAYISLSGHYGYCDITALSKKEVVTTPTGDGSTVLGTATVIAATAPIYSAPNTSAASSTLSIGTTLEVYSYNSTWAYVGSGANRGYMPINKLSATSYAELKSGDSGAAVRDLESALLSGGYFDGAPGTSYSTLTTAAVRRFQTACGLSASGNADLATLRVLYAGSAPAAPMLSLSLSSGEKSDNVTRLQTRLMALGYLTKTGSLDGEYGTTTAAAVKLFQSAMSISITGTADNATVRALWSSSAKTLPSGSKAADATTTSSSGSSSSTYLYSVPTALASYTTSYSSGMSNAEKLEYVIYVAQNQMGKRYVYGTAGTSTFDCSGLTSYCYKQVGVSLNRSAYAQGYDNNYTKISDASSLKRGDLVFLNTISDSDLSDHTGIYLGNYYFIHASSGAGKVVVSNISSGYYNRVYSWGRRILNT